MQPCVIYARVSTKEQQAEGYSIPAQLKAIREFCAREGLAPVEEFIEAESAGKAGRKRFAAMCAYLSANPEVRVVVAHKLDRLYRNFADQLRLEEELGIRARYVIGDTPPTPQGEFVRDVMLSNAKFYLRNLSEEVSKGMREKAEQGGWPFQAPIGYVNDRERRTIEPDDARADSVRYAFKRYASGGVSLSSLADELWRQGLRTKRGNALSVSVLHNLLRNPIYCGRIPYMGDVFPGAHQPLVSVELWEEVQEAFIPNRRRNNAKKRVYTLRDWLYCEECGCKITAGSHKGHVYYRCTNGRGGCSQRSYLREEALMDEVAEILSRIAVDQEIVEALAECARIAEATQHERARRAQDGVARALAANRSRASALLDGLLDGLVDEDAYRAKNEELQAERRALELELSAVERQGFRSSHQVEALARQGAGAHFDFTHASPAEKRKVLETVLCNATIKDGRIANYQYKDPFGFLEMDSKGALRHQWWAILDLNQ